MLNKRAARLLALLLTSSMVLMGPSAAMASTSAGDSKETSQTEQEKEQEADRDTDPAEEKEETKEKIKTNKKKVEKERKKEDDTSSKEKDTFDTQSTKATKAASDDKAEEEDEDQPKAGVSENTDSSPVSGGVKDTDYTYSDDGIVTILTEKKMTISGNVSGNVIVNSPNGANLTFGDLRIAQGMGLRINGTGHVAITLSGRNVLNDIQMNNTAGIKIDGPGIVEANGSITGAAVISGGNIQAPFAAPVNGADVQLYPVSVNGLAGSRLYTISDLRAGTPQAAYSYGGSILTDADGGIIMYLPAGEAAVSLDNVRYEGNVTSQNSSQLHRVAPIVTNTPTVSPTVTGTPTVSPTITGSPTTTPSANETPTITVTPSGIPDRQQANPADNGLFWINPGATYRSGATLQFYATGAGYGPEEPQETNPIRNATRYIPSSWEVSPTNTADGSSDKGSWKKYTEETIGQMASGNYAPGEYRFKDSFVLSTNRVDSVPYTLKVTYKRQTYNGRRWRDDGTTRPKDVSFFIRNISATATATATPSYRPTTTPYYRSGVTTTAARSSVSSNARNARTMDNTPIGPLILLMMAAAGSGAVIFRKKRNRS